MRIYEERFSEQGREYEDMREEKIQRQGVKLSRTEKEKQLLIAERLIEGGERTRREG